MSVSVSNYPQDFPPADAAGLEPVDPTLFLGVHPLLLLLLAALILALMMGAWRAGKGGAAALPDASESIWRAIDRACQAAMKANSDALPGQTKALRAVIDDCLGAVVMLADGPAKPLKTIDQALKGRIKEPVKPKDPHPTPPHGHGHEHPRAHADGKPTPRPQPAHVTIMSSSVVIAADSLVCEAEPVDCRPASPAPAPPHAAHPTPSPHKPEEKEVERDMTHPEQLAALRAAVAQFNDHWCRRAERIAELRAAHRALSTPRGGGRGPNGDGWSQDH